MNAANLLLRVCPIVILLVLSPIRVAGEIESTDGISVNFSGRNSFQALFLVGGFVYVDGKIEVKSGNDTLITMPVSQREPHGTFRFEHPVTGEDVPPGAGFFQRHFFDGLPMGAPLTVEFTGQSAIFLHNGQLHEPQDFSVTTTGTLGVITGDPLGNVPGGVNIVWEDGGFLLGDKDRLDLGEGVTLTIRSATVQSLEPDLNLTRADILLNGGNLIAVDTRFVNISEITLSGDGESTPMFQLTDCVIKSETFPTKIRANDYVIAWDGVVEDHSSLYALSIPDAEEPLPNSGIGQVILQMSGDLSSVDSSTLQVRIFDMAGERVADQAVDDFFTKIRVFNAIRDSTNKNLDEATQLSLIDRAFFLTRDQATDSAGVEVTITDPPEPAFIRNCLLPQTDLQLQVSEGHSANIEDNLLKTISLGASPNFPAFDVEVLRNEVTGIEVYGSGQKIRGNFVRSEFFREQGSVGSGVGIQIGPDDTSGDLQNTQDNEIFGNRVVGFNHGIELRFAEGNLIFDNTVEINRRNLVLHGHTAGGENKTLAENEITNNVFRSPQEFNNQPGLNFLAAGHCAEDFCDNIFADFDVAGPNIVGGESLAGNFWSDYTGADADGDGIGDSPHILGQPANGPAYVDQLPLIIVARGEIVVNDPGDEGDADLTDDIIDADATKLGAQVTLRAALENANVREGLDRITFEPEIEVIEVKGEPIEITEAVEIEGAGEISDLSHEILRNADGPALHFAADASASSLKKLHFKNRGFGAVSDPDQESALRRQMLTLAGAANVSIDECRFSSEEGSTSILLFLTDGGSATVTNSVFSGDGFAGVLVDESPGSVFGRDASGNNFVDVPLIIQGAASVENRVLNNSFSKGQGNNPKAGLEIFGAPSTITSDNRFVGATLRVMENDASDTVIENSTFDVEDGVGGIQIDGAVDTEISLGNRFTDLSPAIHLIDAENTVITGNEFDAAESDDLIPDDVIGILIENSDGSQIGPTEFAQGNLFTNHTVGVAIQSGQRNQVRGNRFRGDILKLMVDLAFDPAQPGKRNANDDDNAAGADNAPNRLQNHPQVHLIGDEVLATLESRPGLTYGIDLYDGSGNPPAQQDVAASGPVTAFSMPAARAGGRRFMTATDPDGNTSEDSPIVAIYIVRSQLDAPDDNPGDGLGSNELFGSTLRAAIQDANALAADGLAFTARIHFDLRDSFTIALGSPLPSLTFPAEIGMSFPQDVIDLFAAIGISPEQFETNSEVVEINGTDIPVAGSVDDREPGLLAESALVMHRTKITEFPSTGLVVTGEKLELKGCQITGNRGGIFLGAESSALIGGDTAVPGEFPGNIISRNFRTDAEDTLASAGAGIAINGGTNFTIQGNLIGVSETGDPSPNKDGIYIEFSDSGERLIHGNVISGNLANGIHLQSCSGILITGNHIGLNTNGGAVANGSLDLDSNEELGNGILIVGEIPDQEDEVVSAGNLIGGNRPGDRNFIAANRVHGIALRGRGVSGTIIRGNTIGDPILANQRNLSLEPRFSDTIGNRQFGIFLDRSPDNVIGGTEPGDENLITSNGEGGVFLSGEKDQLLGVVPVTGNRLIRNVIAYHLERDAGIRVLHGRGNVFSENIMFQNGKFDNFQDGKLLSSQIQVSQEQGDSLSFFEGSPGVFFQALLSDDNKVTLVFDTDEIDLARDFGATLEVFTRNYPSLFRQPPEKGFAMGGWTHFLGTLDLRDPVFNNQNNTVSFELDVSDFPFSDSELSGELMIAVTATGRQQGTSREIFSFVEFVDSDDDGAPDRREEAAVGDGDLNDNGVPDTVDPAVTATPVIGNDGRVVGVLPVAIESLDDSAVEIVQLEAIPAAEAPVPLPENIDSNVGLISLEVEVQTLGGTIRVQIGLPEDSNINAVYKLLRRTQDGELEWALFDDAKVKRGVAELTLTDGEIGDLDLLVNQLIQDPIALVLDPALPPVDHNPIGADADGDGLPDSFELEFFGSTTAAQPDADSDGDGTSELEEFIFGTSPIDPNDVLRLTLVEEDDGEFTLAFPSKPNREYTLESNVDLKRFSPLRENIRGDGNVIAIENLLPGERQHFFRLKVTLPSDNE